MGSSQKVDHFFLERSKPYSEVGRFQTEEEALQCDVEIKQMLDDLSIKYKGVKADNTCVDQILEELRNNM